MTRRPRSRLFWVILCTSLLGAGVTWAAPPARPPAKTTATSPAKITATSPAKCQPCACRKRPEVRIGMTGGVGGFWSKTTGWIRSDGLVRQDLGIRIHRLVELNLNVGSSVQRLHFFFQLGATYYPWRRGPYARLTFDLVLAGVGVQPGLSLALGYSYFTKYPLGLFVELQTSTRLTKPYTVEPVPFGGVFAYF